MEGSHAAARAAKKELKPQVAQKPEGGASSKKEVKPIPFPRVDRPEAIPVFRVGLGTHGRGVPSGRSQIFFTPGADFRIVSLKSRKVAMEGRAGETWSIRAMKRSRGLCEIIMPSGEIHHSYRGPLLVEMVGKEIKVSC